MITPAAVRDRLVEAAARFSADPLGFVQFSYPWGEPGTELEKVRGPRQWQADMLGGIGERVRAGDFPVYQAISSGHGPGKSTLVAWLTHWGLATFADTRCLVTANTQPQLATKTSPELAKWHRRSVFASWFSASTMAIVSNDKGHERTWRCDLATWSVENLEAFQGLHNLGRRIVLIYDEASGIDDAVWDASEGALTDVDTQIIWLVCGNPTQPGGRFFECFNRQRGRWHGVKIDSRTVEGTNKKLFDEWAALYGEDSDFFRVRVRGEFPRAGALQFIGPEAIEQAALREAFSTLPDGLAMGVDVAREGDDQTVIAFRKGRDARTIPWVKMRVPDLMQVAGRVAELAQELRPDAIFIDEGGMGAGVVDRCRQLGLSVIGVQFGAKSDTAAYADERMQAANKRSEMWGNMRRWLKDGAIPDDPELRTDLAGPHYSFVVKDGRDCIALEPKAAMKARGLASPDGADALALTFAYPVAERPQVIAGRWPSRAPLVQNEYDPFQEAS